MLAILEYKAGNQTSVRRALEHLGIPCAVTADPDVLLGAQGIIFPGVGAAGQAMNHLREAGLDRVLRQEDGSPAPVPHMGWNSLTLHRPGRLLAHLPPDAEFYFVHSYYVEPAPELVMATTRYGREFCSVYGRDGLWAVQFHLEKSGRPGLQILRNFFDYCREVCHAQ